MKKWIIILAALAVVGVGVLLLWRPSHHPDYYVSRAIASPLPATLNHVKTISLFEPTMGDGVCVAAYSVTPADFARLLRARPWAGGFITGNFEAGQHFRSVWPDAPTGFEGYHFTIDEWRYVDMAVSSNHTRVIFFILL